MTAATPRAASQDNAPPAEPALNEEERSKDAFFLRMADVVDAMIERHGKDFATGTLILAARFVAEGRPLSRRAPKNEAQTN
jgi:hypothetical protein